MTTNVLAEASSQIDITSANVVVKTETTTQQMTQTNDDEMQIIGEIQRPNSSSVMMPDIIAPPVNPTLDRFRIIRPFLSLSFVKFYQIDDFILINL